MNKITNFINFLTSKETNLTKTFTIKDLIESLKSNYDIDFNKTSFHRLKDKVEKAYENGNYADSHKLDIVADLKELLSDRELNYEDKKFRTSTLLELYFQI